LLLKSRFATFRRMDAQALRSVSFLKNLTDEELQAFSSLVSLREFPAKEKIVSEGKPIEAFHIVCSGHVHARRMAQKREVLLGRIGPGGFFGEINLFDSGFATANVYAMEKVTLALIDYISMRKFMEENPAIGYKITSALMAELSRRLRTTNERFVNSLYWSSLSSTA
jgi:CRP-like cAMP-binding protein